MPTGREGCVVEDIDLVLRGFGTLYHTDDEGILKLIELKYGKAEMGFAKTKTFGLIDRGLKRGEPERYKGYFLINYDNENWDKANFEINRKPVTLTELSRFLMFGDIGITGLNFK